MKKYDKITRHGKKRTRLTVKGNPEIVIMEKLDGANSSFRLVDGGLVCFSRNCRLNEENGLRGFYQWVHKNVDEDKLEEEFIYFGEWLVPHTITYPQEAYNNFYLFDVYNTQTEQYMSIETVKEQAQELGLKLAPIFYHGKFKSLDHVNSFVGESEIGSEGEGVVVKNYSYVDRLGNQVFTKFVSDSFAEKARTKKHNPSKNIGELDDFVDAFLTKPRIEKMLYKLVDENVIGEDFDVTDMGTILKNSASRMAEDILVEELDSLVKIVNKKIGRAYPLAVKEVLSELGRL